MSFEIKVQFSEPVANPPKNNDWNLLLIIDNEFAGLKSYWPLGEATDYIDKVQELKPEWKTFGVYEGGFDKSKIEFIGKALCGMVRE